MGSKEIKALNETTNENQKKESSLFNNYSYEELLNEEDDKKNLTTGERVKDFVSDHSDSFGCLTFFIGLALASWGIYEVHHYFQDKQYQQEVANQRALDDSNKMNSLFMTTLRPLVPKMTRENAPRVLNAVKHLILIEHPNTDQGLDLLCKKYETEYYKHENNYEFETFLAIKSREDMMEKVSRITSSCPSPLIIPQHTR
ncbi:MAG: hypothetical protein J6V53_03090 [Alphaproteobacteria bacterium]|nr:hypothetical protein [Alphaproteobacteria bacterium]